MDERARIARELHDVIVVDLATLALACHAVFGPQAEKTTAWRVSGS